MQAVVPWLSSGVAVATDAEVSLVSHLLARWARVDGEGTLLEMLRDCVLERGMAEGNAVEVEGRFNVGTKIAMWLKGAIVDVGDATSVDVLCMMLNLDYDKTVSINQLQHWRKGLLATAQHKPGKPRLLLSYSDGRTKISRLSSMLPHVANLIIREAPVRLNLQFEELARAISGQSSADNDPRVKFQKTAPADGTGAINIEALCEAPQEALAHSPSQMPLSCLVAPLSQRELHVLWHALRNALRNVLRRVLDVLVLHVSL